jgi:hypothetical protein
VDHFWGRGPDQSLRKKSAAGRQSVISLAKFLKINGRILPVFVEETEKVI